VKRQVVLLTLVVAAAGSCASARAAADRQRPASTLRTLRAEVRALRGRVRALTAERGRLRAALANASRELTRLKAGTIPTPFSVAVEQVRHEVQWAEGSTTAPLRGQFVAEAALDYVVGHVSTGAYGYLELVYGEPPGGPDLPPYHESINGVLGSQTGICVQAERTFAAIVKRLGFPVRDVGFDYVEPNGAPGAHAAAEVYYGGAWHFFDPTFGQFWTDPAGDVLSVEAVRANGGSERRDDVSFTNLIEDTESPSGIDTWFETDPATTVVYAS
jgi:hypothetical protein